MILLKKDENIDFVYQPHMPKSDNVMDRWILASTQSLIAFVREEMKCILNLMNRLSIVYCDSSIIEID